MTTESNLLKPFDHGEGLILLKQVATMLDNAGVVYHLEGGTLLGLVRDGHLLEWDDDMDISIPSEYFKKAKFALYPLILKGWRIDNRRWKLFKQYGFRGTRIIKIRDRSRGIFKTGRVYLDVILKFRLDESVYWQAKKRLMKVNSRYYEGFDEIKIDGFTFKVPVDYKDYLTEKYGDWSKPVKEWDCGIDEKTIVL